MFSIVKKKKKRWAEPKFNLWGPKYEKKKF